MALGTMPISAVMNTAVPSTRAGGARNSDSRKGLSSIAAARRLWLSSARPSFQVTISMKIEPAMSSGNQPPLISLSRLDAQNSTSTQKNTEVAPMQSHSGSFQA